MTRHERVGQNLNRALHRLFAADDRAWLLGEDVADPYGGAFKITQGLSTAYPDRVKSTPLSENGIVGVAGGLALCGDTVIVEIMFGDFVGLAFDQILNFLTKSVGMYGVRTPMRVVIRCPVGGGRGYGATHSQSVQKHFIGIPHLALYELTPFHDAADVLDSALGRAEPCILFEDKALYSQRMFADGRVDDRLRFELLGGEQNWARVHDPKATGAPVLVIAPGGVAHRALAAAGSALDQGRNVEVLVPARLYPFAVEDLLGFVEGADGVIVVEESTSGGTWGSEVATRIYAAAWPLLRRPIELVSSADSVIPSAPHLEREILVRMDDILSRILATGTRPSVVERHAVPAPVPGVAVTDSGEDVTVPKLNNNDTSYVLVEWLVPDGGTVAPGDPLVTIETSKATEELEAEHAGILRQQVRAGLECAPGAVLGRIVPEGSPPQSVVRPQAPTLPVPAVQAPDRRPLPAAQRRIAEVVTTSHREIPVAFTAVRVDMEPALAMIARLAEDADLGVTELLIQVVAGLHERFPQVFSRIDSDGMVADADTPAIGVTVDAGTGLYLPVIRDAAKLSLSDLADTLVELRMKALRGRLREDDMTGMNFLVALNNTPGVVLAQPIIPPGVTCALSIPDLQREAVVEPDGRARARTVADLGLAYDHRLINGAQAGAFLAAVRDAVAALDPR